MECKTGLSAGSLTLGTDSWVSNCSMTTDGKGSGSAYSGPCGSTTGTVIVKRKTLGAATTAKKRPVIPFPFQPTTVGKRVYPICRGGGRTELGHHFLSQPRSDERSVTMSSKLSWTRSCSDGLATVLGKRMLEARDDGAEYSSTYEGKGADGLESPSIEVELPLVPRGETACGDLSCVAPV